MNQHWQYSPPMVQPVFQVVYLSPCQWCMDMNGSPFCVGHIVPSRFQQYLAPSQQYYQLPIQEYQSRSPSWGPCRNQHQRFHWAEAPSHNHKKPGSSRRVAEDCSFGIDSGHACIGADESPGIGMVWRTPPKNPLIVDRNLFHQIRYSPYRRNHRPRMTRDVEVNPTADTRDGVDTSVYAIHTNSTSVLPSNLYLIHFINNSCRRGNGNNTISIDRSC